MSEQSYYEQLGVKEDASFEEIQDAKTRLVQEHSGDRKRVEMIETAYDAILMERLRLRQEGKIKVPEGIRFPEKVTAPPPTPAPAPPQQAPAWLQRFIDTPSRSDILWSAGIFGALSVISVAATVGTAGSSLLQLALAFGVGATLYFLNRKEHKFGRSLLLTLTSLIGGLILGALLWQIAPLGVTQEKFITLVTFVIFWLVSSFLR
jgi:hypothetical protein